MGKSAKVVADEPAVDAGHSMSLAVAPNIQLELEISDAVGDNSHRIGSYRVMGPAREWHMLEQACDVNLADETLHVRGALSSIQPITMPPEMHEAAGVADGATHFAFAYPAQYAVARKEAEGRDPFPASFYEALGLVRVGPVAWQIATSKRAGGKGKLPSLPPLKRPGPAAAIKSPAQLEGGAAPGDSSAGLSALSAPGGANERPLWGSTPEPTLIFREIDKRLAALNLADETWAFLLLVGGFLFFDSERRLISVSALTLVPSIWQIHLDGPFTPSRAALHGLRAEGKLQAVTLDALVESGCAAFGWSHAGEAPGGHRLDEDLATKIEHGCFVYEMKGAPPTYFCIAPHTTDELAKFSEEMEMLQEHRSKGPPGMDRALSLSALTQPMSVREIMEGKPLVALLGGMVGGANTLVGGAQRAMAQAEREVKEMNKLTTEMGDAEGNRLAGRWGLQLRRILIVVLGALPVLAILTSLAYLDGYAYELLACFVWNACNTPRSLVVASFDTQLEAATRLQAQTRGLRERRRVRAELAERRRRMHQFSWPMLLATMIDLIGNSVVSDMMHRAGGFEQSAALWSLAFALPGTFIIVYDLRRDDRPRFSLAHGIFFVGVLFRVGSKAVVINTYVWDYLTDYFTRSSGELGAIVGAAGVPLTYDATVAIAVSLLTMTVHILIFICVTTFGKLTLDMVATPNACPHLIFPFQFFDYVFLYSFFNLRDIGSITASWVLTQVLVQVNVILRNSGTNDAIMQNYFGRFFRLLLCQRAQDSLKEFDPNLDPLIRLQFLARVGWQFDLADVAALIATPAIVTLLVWRDGYYTLEGTDILVRACDLYNVWLRFGILLVIKPAASGIARLWLRRKMRKTLLGKRTMHGTSRIAAQIVAERRLKMGHSGKGKGRNVDEKVLDHFDFKEEELAAVREELSFSTLNFSVLRAKSMKKWRYYLSVIILQLFSAFPCRRSVPNGLSGQWQDPGTGARSVAVEMSMLPLSSSWFYVPHNMAPALSATLNRTLYSTAKDPTDLFACKLGQTAYKGWPSRWAEPGDSRSVATSIEQADKVLNSLEDSVEIDARLASPVWKQYLLPKVQAAPQDDDIIHVVAGAVVYAVLAIAVLVLVWFTLRLCLRSSAKVAPKSKVAAQGLPRWQPKAAE